MAIPQAKPNVFSSVVDSSEYSEYRVVKCKGVSLVLNTTMTVHDCYHVDVFKAQLTRSLTVNARAIRLQVVQATLWTAITMQRMSW